MPEPSDLKAACQRLAEKIRNHPWFVAIGIYDESSFVVYVDKKLHLKHPVVVQLQQQGWEGYAVQVKATGFPKPAEETR